MANRPCGLALKEIALLDDQVVSPQETEAMLKAARSSMKTIRAQSEYAELTEGDVQLLLGKQA